MGVGEHLAFPVDALSSHTVRAHSRPVSLLRGIRRGSGGGNDATYRGSNSCPEVSRQTPSSPFRRTRTHSRVSTASATVLTEASLQCGRHHQVTQLRTQRCEGTTTPRPLGGSDLTREMWAQPLRQPRGQGSRAGPAPTALPSHPLAHRGAFRDGTTPVLWPATCPQTQLQGAPYTCQSVDLSPNIDDS